MVAEVGLKDYPPKARANISRLAVPEKSIAANAITALDRDEYAKNYESLTERYQALQKRYTALTRQRGDGDDVMYTCKLRVGYKGRLFFCY